MTSPSSLNGVQVVGDNADPYYTNEDVAILHDIVLRAQELLPSLPDRERVPTNALFNAYYAILPSIGVDTDHDSRYARVLFKIGGMQGRGNLYEKFEAVLLRMGIEIQFDHETDQQASPIGSQPAVGASSHGHGSVRSVDLRTRPRRNSDSTIWESVGAERSAQHSRPRQPLSDAGGREAVDSVTAKHADDQQRPGPRDIGRNVGLWLKEHAMFELNFTAPPSVSGSSDQGAREFRRYSGAHEHATGSSLSTSATEAILGHVLESTDEILPGKQESRILHPQQRLPRDIVTLEARANRFEQQHASASCRLFLRTWLKKALQSHEDNANMELMAHHQDKHILLKQAFDTWRIYLQENRRRADTERFFALIGKRAARARDIYLLTKAFTHWAQTTSDEIQRTSIARRHVLSIRYFSAWRDITAVNELKVRRHITRRFFSTWRARHVTLCDNSRQAVVIYQGNLVRDTYWVWFWEFCDHRAPVWHREKLRQNGLASWISSFRHRQAIHKTAIEHSQRRLQQRYLLLWQSDAHARAQGVLKASQDEGTKLLSKALLRWRSESAFVKPRHEVQDASNIRLKRNLLSIWRRQASHERQASEIDRLKIMHEAWSAWNVKVRCRVVHLRIDERLAVQCLYKWVIHERFVLTQRLRDQRLKQKVLACVMRAFRDSLSNEEHELRTAEAARERMLKARAFGVWHLRHAQVKEQERLALDVYAPKIVEPAMQTWIDRAKYVSHISQSATSKLHAVVIRRAFEAWKASLDTSKREKRRQLYSQIRRKKKMALVAAALAHWRQNASDIAELKQRADSRGHDRNTRITANALATWRNRSAEVQNMVSTSAQVTLKKYTQEWGVRIVLRRQLEIDASFSLDERLIEKGLRKWSRKALQSRAREYVVAEVREKYGKKACRRILFHWQQRVGHVKLDRDDVEATFGNTERTEDWSEFGGEVEQLDHEVDEPANLLVPGYLATPSRRVSRISHAIRTSTTPMAPLSTPFERRLRAEYSGGSLVDFLGSRNGSMDHKLPYNGSRRTQG